MLLLPPSTHSLSLTLGRIYWKYELFRDEEGGFPHFYLMAEALGYILGTAFLWLLVT